NAGVIGASRITYAMATYRQLPEVFRRLHPRFKTPWLSLVIESNPAKITSESQGVLNLGCDLPAASRGLPSVASEVQDSLALARDLRRVALDRRPSSWKDGLPRRDVRIRRDALVHDRASRRDRTARAHGRRRGGLQGRSQ